MKRNLLATFCLFLLSLCTAGCGSNAAVEIPEEPAPMPTTGPENAGSAIPSP